MKPSRKQLLGITKRAHIGLGFRDDAQCPTAVIRAVINANTLKRHVLGAAPRGYLRGYLCRGGTP